MVRRSQESYTVPVSVSSVNRERMLQCRCTEVHSLPLAKLPLLTGSAGAPFNCAVSLDNSVATVTTQYFSYIV